MKNRKVLLFATGAAAVIFAGVAITISAVGTQSSGAAVLETPSKYIVREESGRVAVFSGDSERPEIYTDINTSRLREYDRALLENGIEIEGYDSVIGILEDFSN